MEEWRDIKGYEGIYQVSNLGRVRSLDRFVRTHERFGGTRLVKGKIKSLPLLVGYPTVNLDKDYKHKVEYVHRLVAEAFIPNPENKPEVNHKDANKTNNNAENLEWVTHLENVQHSERLGLRTPNTKASNKAHERKVIRSDGIVFDSIKEAAKSINQKGHANIVAVCNGRRNTAGGYGWKYYEDIEDES